MTPILVPGEDRFETGEGERLVYMLVHHDPVTIHDLLHGPVTFGAGIEYIKCDTQQYRSTWLGDVYVARAADDGPRLLRMLQLAEMAIGLAVLLQKIDRDAEHSP